MAETITEWQRRQFNANVHWVYQQMETMATKYVDAEMVHNGVQGNLDDFDVVGSMVARDKVDRYEETKWGELEKSRRWARPYMSYQALPLDRFDKVRSAISDINSVHTRGIVAALKRAEDKRYFTAAIGTALTGENATGTSALPSSQQIALGSSPNDILTLDKIKLASAKLDDAAVPVGPGKRIWFFSPGQKSAILAITQAASSDFTARRIYDKGNIDGDEWMGFFWKMIPDVKSQGASGITTLLRMLPLSGTTRTNIVCASDAVGISRCDNLRTELDVLPQKTYIWQAFGSIDVDCVRVRDGGAISVACLEQTT